MNEVWSALNHWAGGYGAYILPAYGVSALGLGGAVLATVKSWRAAKTRLAALEKDRSP